MNDKSRQSLLSREESAGIKGLLILLVILGHNSVLMNITGLFPYVYSFHVYDFYILPVIYGIKDLPNKSKGTFIFLRLGRNICRIYPIFFGWCFFSTLITCCIKSSWQFSCRNFLSAIVFGNDQLREYCGAAFLWFLPTLVAVMFWRDCYFVFEKKLSRLLAFSSAIPWILSMVGVLDYRVAGRYMPFSFYQGLAFFFSGFVTRLILERTSNNILVRKLSVPLFLLVPIFIYCRQLLPFFCNYFSWSLMPIIAFVAIYQWRHVLARLGWLTWLGKNSLPLYLMHVFVFNGLFRIVSLNNLWWGVCLYVFTLGICIAFICLFSNTFIKKIWTFGH